MNLNQPDREAFVRAVIDDVPTVDYMTQAQDITIAAVVKLLPKEVQAVYKMYPEYLDRRMPNTPSGLSEPYIPVPKSNNGSIDYFCIKNRDPETWARLEELSKLHIAQQDRLDKLRSMLRGVIGACRTLKQAKERLPEFAKYLPAERAKTGAVNLPVANLVATLSDAGWPKRTKNEG